MLSDVLVIGAGGAGLCAAIAASEEGVRVRVLTKEYPTRSQTCMAQGGMNAVLANESEDSIDAHVQDTLKAAQGLADEEAVHFMCAQAPSAIAWLDSIGVPFSRRADGTIAQRKLGGASAPRACYAQDYTGLKILHTLYDKALSLGGIELLSDKYLLDLLRNTQGEVCGAKVLDIRTGAVQTYFAKSVVLASGGYSRIYGAYSTNSQTSTGDGIAAAQRVGAKLLDMEFVQFHPTGLKNSSILISESARGEGGYLLNSQGERFTDELQPRDALSRAIDAQMKKGEDIFIDIRHLGEAFIDENLPQERKLAQLYEGVDPVHELIPIKPVAHYTMGGIEVDHKSQTNIQGLFACGECANHKVHGANRLGGNSLLEIVVFGREAGYNAAQHAQSLDDFNTALQEYRDVLEDIKHFEAQQNFYALDQELSHTFYTKVGIVRKPAELQEVLTLLKTTYAKLPQMGPQDMHLEANTNLIEFLEFKNMLELRISVVEAALKRTRSCGAHFIDEESSDEA